MLRAVVLPILLSLALGATWMGVEAAGPIFWQVTTRADFMKGEVETVAVDADGRLRLGPPITLVHDSGAPFLWSAVRGRDGMLYVGSGNEGRVFRIDGAGKATIFFDAAEPEVHGVALAPDGAIYAATSPDGKVYRIDAAGGSRVWFDPDERYIWALAVDPTGSLFVATGEKGVIYRVTPDGKWSVFYKAGVTHVVTLAFDRSGALLAGTDSPGRLLRISADGRPTVLLDTGFREAHAIEVDAKGTIYVAALDGAREPGTRTEGGATPEPPKTIPVPSVSTEITAIAILDVGAVSAEEKPAESGGPAAGAKGAVFRILADGSWDTVWESPDDLPFDLALEPEGSLLVATGNQGRLFRLEGEPLRATLIGRVPAQQAIALVPDAKGELALLTANPGKVVRLGRGVGASGTYDSDIRDTRTVSTWGTISWRATTPPGSRAEIFTRTGNTSRPDETWSPWTGPYADADGDQIRSPKARYIQWRAVMRATADAPVLTSVTLAYLPRNMRPRVTAITVHPPGLVFQKPYSTGELEIAGFASPTPDARPGGLVALPALSSAPIVGRRIFQKGLQTLQWKAEDANDDTLRYDVLYRLAIESGWKALERGLADPLVVWDTTSVPNGTYVVRIVATDGLANTPDTALTGDLDSVAFDVDNTPPTIRVSAVRREGDRIVVEFDATDDHSPVQRVDYSIDAGSWTRLHPADGLADSRRERFRLAVPWNASAQTLVLRAVDALGNVATQKVDGPAGQD